MKKYYVVAIERHPVPGHTRVEGYAVCHAVKGKNVRDGQFNVNHDRPPTVAKFLADALCKDLNEGIA
jgi:hypothetical protein